MSDSLTVSDLTQHLKSHLGEVFGRVRVTGEISTFTAHRSGHWYFAIKDDNAVLNCVMFRGANRMVRDLPAVGDEVVLDGGIDVYAPQGRYNLIVRSLAHAGAGDLAQQLEALKKKLASEGLFDPGRKQPIPPLPDTIGVVTSPTGAALQDILKVLQRRFPGRHVLLAPCRVQGAGAAAEVASAIRQLDRDGRAQVIICGRGGGSQEDLAAFNDEALARTIAACSIPVVSAVGHETDVSIADLVADVRAATPSHAAELVVPERDALAGFVDELSERLMVGVVRSVRKRRERLDAITLRDPRRQVEDGRLRLDDLSDRLLVSGALGVERRRKDVASLGGRLDALSPLRVLERGYAVVQKTGTIVREASSLQSGDLVDIRLVDGTVAATVD